MNSKEKILIYHNNPPDYKDIRKVLEENSFTLLESKDREFFSQLFSSVQPDLILLDMTHSESMHILSLTGENPVILISDTEERVAEGLNAGAEDYILKPVNMSLLLHKIKKSLKEKKLKEENKLLSEKNYTHRTLIENINDVIFSVDMEGNVTYISSVIERISKYNVQDFTGKHISKFIHPDDLPAVLERYRLIFEGEMTPYEYRLIDKDGGIIHIRSYSRPLYKDGIATGVTGLLTDITERKEVEKTLRESEEKLRLKLTNVLSHDYEVEEEELKNIIEGSELQILMDDFNKLTDIGMAILDLKGNILVGTGWQDICSKFHRLHPETGKNCTESDCYLTENVKMGQYLAYKCKNNMWDIVTPVVIGGKHMGNFFTGQFFYDDEKLDYDMFVSQAKKYSFNIDEYIAALEKVPRWSKDRVKHVMDFYVKLIEVISTLSYGNIKLAQEILERKRAEEELRGSRAMLANIMNSIPQSVFWKDRNSVYMGCNQVFAEAVGIDNTEEIKGKTDFDLPWPEDETKVYRADDREVMEKNIIKRHIIEPLQQSDGKRLIIDTTKIPLTDQDGNIYGILGVYDDITERKKAEEEIKQFYHTLNSSLNEIYIFDKETLLFKFVSAGALRNLGYTIEEIKHLTPVDIKPDFDINSFKKLIFPLISGEKNKIVVETRHRRSDGTFYPVELHLQLYEDMKEFLAVILDITERKKLEEQLLQSRKMESVGRLAGGIAHDFNNILAIILGHGEIMEDELPENSPFRSEVDIIIRATNRAKDLTKQLLAFARKQTMAMKPVSLNRVITDFEKILRRTIRENITIEMNLSPSLKIIKGDEGQIEQIILNLCLNAQDAMPDGGTLLIETEEALLDEAYVTSHEGVNPGIYAMMAISDTGEGMPKETLGKIFDPFFSTKELGRGTGLGLSSVYGIVKQHMGHINVYSEAGKGSTFKVYLPVIEENTAVSENISVQSKPYYGNETVLLVEDEEHVRELACAILKKYGYKVFEASGGEMALKLSEDYGETIELLVTDVIMGDTNGKELYEKLSVKRPGLKVLYMSGYTENLIGHHGILYEGVNFIQKPFSLKDFACKVRKILD
ncbi:MAG: PocR ligand-binding domain-containing protein [Candidatus Eremiobacterota bacterium]